MIMDRGAKVALSSFVALLLLLIGLIVYDFSANDNPVCLRSVYGVQVKCANCGVVSSVICPKGITVECMHGWRCSHCYSTRFQTRSGPGLFGWVDVGTKESFGMAAKGFDESKDEVVVGPVVADTDDSTFELKIVRYNGGEEKLQISRFTGEEPDRRYQKMGRLTHDEWLAIAQSADELWGEVK